MKYLPTTRCGATLVLRLIRLLNARLSRGTSVSSLAPVMGEPIFRDAISSTASAALKRAALGMFFAYWQGWS